MKNVLQKIKDVSAVVLFFTLLITVSVLCEMFPLFQYNVFAAGAILTLLALSRGGFAYPIKYERYNNGLDWMYGYKIKKNWTVFMGIITVFCFPIGLLIRKVYYSFSTKKDRSFTKWFYFFFEKEPMTL